MRSMDSRDRPDETAMFRYWGKARPGPVGPTYHPLPYHCMDVAAVGVTYLRSAPKVRALFMRWLKLDSVSVLESWFAFWLSIHDLGKFSESFQAQKPELVLQLRGRLPDLFRNYGIRHDTLGMLLWKEALSVVAEREAWFGRDTSALLDGVDYWVRAVTGHHGQPPDIAVDWKRYFNAEEDYPAVLAFVSEMRKMFLGDAVMADLSPILSDGNFLELSEESSWWVAGLTVLADWIGSNTDFFVYHAPDVQLDQYWELAQQSAAQALKSAGVLPCSRGRQLGFDELFPEITTPSGLQNWAATVEIPAGPQLYLLEDITGAGKTEAALILAHRLISAGHADGFFIGLPTMATANAMYGRVGEVHTQLFDAFASFVLAQSQRNLVDEFVKSVVRNDSEERDPQQADDSATARCSAWLADNNKRSLLAPAAVGTIDQALLAVLHSKHQSLRLLGLVGKVLIVDEVHACDTYMQSVLQTLLEFHARAGGSAILLSATMPGAMKRALLAGFSKGTEVRGSLPTLNKQAYPLVTRWVPDSVLPLLEVDLEARPDVTRNVQVRYISDEREIFAGIEQELRKGRCVCWMRNTVSDALVAHAHFRTLLPQDKLVLFHARFALGDRLEIERRVLGLFGKHSGPDDRRGCLVIATQVAEQSLDADWDLVVSDLAPIDRLVQRAGRLMRHRRDQHGARLRAGMGQDGRGEPCLWVLGPVWVEEPPADWFKAMFPKAAFVYPNHGQLWLTARFLMRGSFSMPRNARELIEGVFGDVETPPGLDANAREVEAKHYKDKSIAQQHALKLVTGYAKGAIDWWSDARTPSRLGEPTRDVVLARWEGDQLLPWIGGPNGWSYSAVRVPERLIAERQVDPAPERERAIGETLLALPNQGKWCVLLPLVKTEEAWMGSALTAARNKEPATGRQWRYDPFSGLSEADTPDGLPEE